MVDSNDMCDRIDEKPAMLALDRLDNVSGVVLGIDPQGAGMDAGSADAEEVETGGNGTSPPVNLSGLTVKITVYDAKGSVIDVRVVMNEWEIMRVLGNDLRILCR